MIPAKAHFIWLGKKFPWLHALAIRSCCERGGFEKVVLHCSDDLSDSAHWNYVSVCKNFEFRKINPEKVLKAPDKYGEDLTELYSRLSWPASKVNMLRAAILAVEGGVYLDIDTVTVASMKDILESSGVFFGEERIVFPEKVVNSRRPDIKALAYIKTAFRDLCRRRRDGWRAFRKWEHHYHLAANNAVIGSEAGHPFVMEMLKRMVSMPEKRRTVRYALGTHLLQQAKADNKDSSVKVLSPRYFYPLGPEISQHWFRKNTTAKISDILFPETRIIHWYASVRTKKIVPLINPETVAEWKDSIPICELAAQFLPRENKQ
ncbi:MAG: glycosyltransferase [bacterium]